MRSTVLRVLYVPLDLFTAGAYGWPWPMQRGVPLRHRAARLETLVLVGEVRQDEHGRFAVAEPL